MGYSLSTLKKLAEDDIEIHVVHWDERKITPYQFHQLSNVYFYPRSQLNSLSIIDLIERINPEIAVVSGWEDFEYLKACRYLIKKNVKTVCGFDDQWHGTLKQYFAAFIGALKIFNIWFSHAWVCGPKQYEYARMLGFSKDEIVFDLYSADIELFNKGYNKYFQAKALNYPHRFLFVGRFEDPKGLDILTAAWSSLGSHRKDWSLTLVGNGSLKSSIAKLENIDVIDFMQPELLVDLIGICGCFILPSRFEPWGVVVHEFSAGGMPLILSDSVGSSDLFLISGYNGYSFRNNSISDLREKMIKIINLSDESLIEMSTRSSLLSKRITPESSSKNLLSIS